MADNVAKEVAALERLTVHQLRERYAQAFGEPTHVEREIIAERTRNKIAATRRKGKWSGGPSVLGYDLDPERPRLVVNAAEAAQVRAIFQLYAEHEALLPVVQELHRRGWTTKRWTTRQGQTRGGLPFTKTRLHHLLTNVLYTGQVRYKQEVHAGEHPPLVTAETWQRVQTTLARNGRSGGAAVRNRFGAILKGLVRCGPCGCAMTPTHTTRRGRRYRYYLCGTAQKQGWEACPAPSVAAGALEQLVLEQVQRLAQDPALVAATLREAEVLQAQRQQERKVEEQELGRDLQRWQRELERLALRPTTPDSLALAADLQERVRRAEARLGELKRACEAATPITLDEAQVRATLAAFGPVWTALAPHEQGQLVRLLVAQVNYDGRDGTTAITFHPTGLSALAAPNN